MVSLIYFFVIVEVFFMHRRKLSRRASRKMFRRSSSRTHRSNLRGTRPMRGGFRL